MHTQNLTLQFGSALGFLGDGALLAVPCAGMQIEVSSGSLQHIAFTLVDLMQRELTMIAPNVNGELDFSNGIALAATALNVLTSESPTAYTYMKVSCTGSGLSNVVWSA